jgi:hypothetical protein
MINHLPEKVFDKTTAPPELPMALFSNKTVWRVSPRPSASNDLCSAENGGAC